MDNPNALDQFVDGVILLANKLKARPFDRRASKLSRSERQVMQLIAYEQDMTISRLARRRCTSRQNIRVLVNRLNQLGWVVKSTNPDHKRSSHLRLSVAGAQVLSEADDSGWQDVLSDVATEREIEGVVGIISRIENYLRQGAVSERGAPRTKQLTGKQAAKRAPVVHQRPEPEASAGQTTPDETELPVNLL